MILEGLSWQYGVYPVLSLAIHLAIGFFAVNRGRTPGRGVAGGRAAGVSRH